MDTCGLLLRYRGSNTCRNFKFSLEFHGTERTHTATRRGRAASGRRAITKADSDHRRHSSTLGESLNTLLPILALTLRLNASIILPQLPDEQFSRSIQSSAIDLDRVFNLQQLAHALGASVFIKPMRWLHQLPEAYVLNGPLESIAATEALISRVAALARQRRGRSPLVVSARMNSFSSLGCGLCESPRRAPMEPGSPRAV